jgi:hypothetical protein
MCLCWLRFGRLRHCCLVAPIDRVDFRRSVVAELHACSSLEAIYATHKGAPTASRVFTYGHQNCWHSVACSNWKLAGWLTIHSSRSRFAARLNSGVMRGRTRACCSAAHACPSRSSPAKPASASNAFAPSHPAVPGFSTRRLYLRPGKLAASFPGIHALIPAHRLFRAKIASAAALRRLAGAA